MLEFLRNKILPLILFLGELIILIVLAYFTVRLIHTFVFQPYYVVGPSMEPNFYDQDYLLIDKISYHFSTPERGEIVIVKMPNNQKSLIIKRVIGLPGETVKVLDGKVYIFNDQYPSSARLSEPYLLEGLETKGEIERKLGLNEYFVMGDNRPVSYDGRSFGPIDKSLIVGRTLFRVWPFSHIKFFGDPTYQYIFN